MIGCVRRSGAACCRRRGAITFGGYRNQREQCSAFFAVVGRVLPVLDADV